MKRSLDRKTTKKQALPVNEYAGFVVEGPAIETVRSKEGFFERFVEKRTPVKIISPELVPVDMAAFRVDRILDTLAEANDRKLQVERKHGLGFGSGKKREELAFSEIVEKLASGDESYYLTTQYESHEYEEGDGDEKDGGEGSEEENFLNEGGIDEDEDEDEKSEDEAGDDEAGDDKNNGFSSPGLDSDNESINFENLHDDFDDLENSEEDFVVPDHKLTQDEVDFRINTLLQAPLTELYKKDDFPLVPDIFGPLIPQQINLWMGACKDGEKAKPELKNITKESLGRYVPKGNSSGLHHDHADNLYVLVQGRKRFTLYSPKDAEKLKTVGEIRRVFPNGLIDYKVNEKARFWRPMREDGAMLGEWARWMIEKGDFSKISKDELEEIIENDEPFAENGESDLDPPSFSTVPPLLAHLDEVSEEDRKKLEIYAEANFPGFLDLQKLEVWLEPGEMLYLPTGWFHEVTSLAEGSGGAHVALNWWFVPPTGNKENPYPDNYWQEDYEKTLAAIAYQRSRPA
ncbi:uncharacterized protein CXQ87_002532 [Candidozyma duobushaemuli]|uniref:JmjC domain-containing protein n=2 Tax=Candidozyma TaxID=3303203 RepID=A0ABX8I4Q5_9ASCO|nr:uncharacterized protein CXQ87_002532 [[Candida] duobushaemulonis]PVH14398.1 hypothetical protein CXQ87_002532 [[Candida] duobushaemulonis]QWU87429.1 hypothetical protein CA3LBN_001694 [[Candida] haemuloni]